MTREENESQDSLCLNFCVSRYIYNNKHLFSDLHSISYEFVIIDEEIVRLDIMGIVFLSTCNRVIIIPDNIAYILRCDFNLISLGQLQKSGITYHNYAEYMILKQGSNIV